MAWLLTASYESSEFAKALANGLRSAAIIYLTVEILRQLNMEAGVGARIFKWHKSVRHQLVDMLSWLRWIVIPAAFVAGVMDFQTNEIFCNALGRVAFVVPMIVLSVVAYRVARPGSSLMTRLTSTGRHKWLHSLRHVIAGAAVGVPAGLAIASFMGYHYTAYYLAWRFIETIWILLALLLFDAFSHHWLRLRIRARALEQAASHATEVTAAGALKVTGDGTEVPIENEEMDVATINAQTSRILNTVVIGGAIAGAWLIWSEVLPALSVLDEIKLWATSVETAETVTRPDETTTVNRYTLQVPVTLTDLGFSIILLVVAFVAARNLPGLLDISLLERLPLAPSVRYAITSLSKYTIAAIGIFMAFNAIGVSWSKVQWLVAAMTVGLAFGLQEIFANLVSGIIILFERPIRVGDVVTVGDVSGTVSRIRIRATTITDWDRRDLIVPNKHFITEQILNWTLSGAIVRVVFPVSVGRESEVGRVRETLRAQASEHPMVLKDPKPSVIFKGSGPGALQFELRVFVRREDYSEVLDAVNAAIEAGLKKANIEIAVDRREI
ncbi:MAG: mechanosensitive ion channel [Gammaproteobacteria bacterium]|nr:mechanosensitive ion channel [Gammaproteobacteria bacterium]